MPKKIFIVLLLLLTPVFYISCERDNMFRNAMIGAVLPGQRTIHMYSTSSGFMGDFGGRAKADSECIKALPVVLGLKTNVRAFLSVDASDQIKNMPANYYVPTTEPILGPTGIPIASNWNDLLDGSILVTLSEAGITSSSWWSGSNADGTVSTNCSSWTTSVAVNGYVGAANMKDTFWIFSANPPCNGGAVILCIAW